MSTDITALSDRNIFEGRIGDIFDKPDLSALEHLKRETEARLERAMNFEDFVFYEEALTLLSASILALSLDIHETVVDKNKVTEVNECILLIVEQSVKVATTIIEIFKDKSLLPSLDIPAGERDKIPYEEIFVFPEKQKLYEMQKTFVSEVIRNSDLFYQSQATALELNVKKLYKQFDKFYREITESLWKDLEREQFGTVIPAPVLKGEARHLKNVIFDEKSHLKSVEGAAFSEGRIYGDGDCGFSSTNTTREEVVQYLMEQRDNVDVRGLVAPEIKGWLKGLLLDDSDLSQASKDAMQRYHSLHGEMDDMLRDLQKYLNDETGHEAVIEIPGMAKDEVVLNWELLCTELPNGAVFADVDIPSNFFMEYRLIRDNAEALLESLAMNKDVFLTYIEEWYMIGRYLILPDPGTTGVMNVISTWKGTPVRIWKLDENNDEIYLRYSTDPITDANKGEVLDIIHRQLHYNKLIPTVGFAKSGETPVLGDIARFAALKIYED